MRERPHRASCPVKKDDKAMSLYRRTNERGSALVYILIAIALLAALTVSFMEPASQQTQSQNSFKMVSEFEAQIDFIRTAVQECVILYQMGDNGIDSTAGGAVTLTEGANKKFPIDPRSSYLTNPSASADPLVRELRCPGNPGDNADHQPVFSGSSGKFLGPPPAMFEEWRWYNGLDGIFFWTYTLNTDAFIQTSMDKLNESFGLCEADVVRTGAISMDMDNAGDVVCPANATCFRLWMSVDNETAVDLEESLYPDPSPAEAGNCP